MSDETNSYRVWYFAMPAPEMGIYNRKVYEPGDWLVFVRNESTPVWWREIARFRDQERAESYASFENQFAADDPPADAQPADPAIVPVIPESALQKIAAILALAKAGYMVPPSEVPDVSSIPAV